MPHRILSEDWSEYDNKKKKYEDKFFFSCDEAWEVDYLLKKIKRQLPHKTDTDIRNAINSCCREIAAPRPRKAFVECVMSKLR